MPRALISVSDKTGLVAFARDLVARGYEIVSTGGTARALEEAGVPVTPVSAVTGFPEMLDGRVKTLHPAVHGGVLARRDREDDMFALDRLRIRPIDVVAVNLYPFQQTASNPAASFDELIEEIDIGGPTLVRAAAKNFRDVLVIVDPADYKDLLGQLDAPAGPPPAWRFDLARKAFAHTAAYDAAISATLATVASTEQGFSRQAETGWPARVVLAVDKVRDLRYGENPHQRAAWFEQPGRARPRVVQGKALSFTNLLDLDAAVRIVAEFDEPAAVVIKHANPCGVAIGRSPAEAYVRARDADSLSAFGGIVGVNRPIDDEAAQAIVSSFIEAVIAPGLSDQAAAILARKPNMRVVIAPPLAEPRTADPVREGELRSIFAGVLAQEADRVVEAKGPWPPPAGSGLGIRVVTTRAPTAYEWAALRFAWRVVAHVKSNAIVFTSDDRTLAIGAGQTSRVDAVKLAVIKAGPETTLTASVAASDAFFPFRDGLDAVAAADASAVVQPGGSVRDAEVIAAANEHRLAMVFTGRRHFRH